jgi:hypothetical protein
MKGEDYDTIIVKLLNATESEKVEQGDTKGVPVQA